MENVIATLVFVFLVIPMPLLLPALPFVHNFYDVPGAEARRRHHQVVERGRARTMNHPSAAVSSRVLVVVFVIPQQGSIAP